jgi:hypothetical protein
MKCSALVTECPASKCKLNQQIVLLSRSLAFSSTPPQLSGHCPFKCLFIQISTLSLVMDQLLATALLLLIVSALSDSRLHSLGHFAPY